MSRHSLSVAIALLVASFTLFTGAGCSAKATPSPTSPSIPPVVADVVSPSSVIIKGINTLSLVGERVWLTAVVTFSDGHAEDETATANWSIADPDVASVSIDGIVTALEDGHTIVTVTFETVSDTHRIVVDLPTDTSPPQLF